MRVGSDDSVYWALAADDRSHLYRSDGDRMTQDTSSAISALRWLAVLPLALAAAYASYYASWIIMAALLWTNGVSPTGFQGRAILYAISHSGMGFAFVSAGWWLAPRLKKQTAYMLAAAGLVLSGVGLAAAIVTEQYSALWPLFWMAASAGYTAYAISEGAEPRLE
jgi:hypothetical protein